MPEFARCDVMLCNVTCVFRPVRILYTPQRDPVVMSYGPAPLLGELGLYTERIIVPFSHRKAWTTRVPSPCSHGCTVCDTVCLTVMPAFSDTTDVSTIGHSFKTDRSRIPLISRRPARRRHYWPIIKSQKTARSVAGVEPTTFRTAATDDDKDWRLYRNGHRGLCYRRMAVTYNYVNYKSAMCH